MITKIYRVKGTFVMGDEFHKFVKEYKATSEADIEEKIYERFGSKHGINRNQIKISEIAEIAPEDVQDPIVKEIL
ncbi:50S ribosomal protein L18Ae [Methanobrevibacter millerae]|uniref:Large ribosomal subunit protein eL20 n=1 Tax=Methanobrevibacter millerae TaxID=230361 RepID=A0A8T3VKK1_9EURY|nr:50S ribosomal protein L18Ae [Methanobrevibacter millerae]MBE6505773.1 50S ribosomal protein L18a [Methanobrevibacter millerae]MBR0059371.1 50S ribosomal protein L18a [Methanobrevibacter sp.]MBR0371889.1 50S ribosomal protein L18a [Methanobrevibacter sp.]